MQPTRFPGGKMKKYTHEENERLRRIVKNFNAKRKRANRRGIKTTSERLTVYDLKQRYKNRPQTEMEKEINLLQSFSTRNTTKQYVNPKGATIPKWQLDYLKLQQEGTKRELLRRQQVLSSKLPTMPGERLPLTNVTRKLNILNKPIQEMSQSELNTFRATIDDYLGMAAKRRGGYRGFLSEIDAVMRRTGYDDATINGMHRKFSKLDPDQFLKLHEENDLIARVYELADSPSYEHGIKLNTSVDNAREILDALIDEVDDLVDKYKEY